MVAGQSYSNFMASTVKLRYDTVAVLGIWDHNINNYGCGPCNNCSSLGDETLASPLEVHRPAVGQPGRRIRFSIVPLSVSSIWSGIVSPELPKVLD